MMVQFRGGGLPDPCFLCGQLVAGMTGQDWYVQPFFLRNSVLRGGAHLRCLVNSDHGSTVYQGTLAYYGERWPRFVSGDWGSVHHEEYNEKFYCLGHDGWAADFPDSALASATLGPDGRWRVPVESVVGHIEGPFDTVVGEAFGADLEQLVSLAQFVDRLGLTDRLLDPAAIVDGTVRAEEEAEEYIASHLLLLDQRMYEAAVKAAALPV